jgi:hypothetical protein
MTTTLDRLPGTATALRRDRAGWSAARVASMLVGAALALCSLALIATGGYLLSAANADGGWLDLGHANFATDGYAVTTEPVDWSQQAYVLGNVDRVRIRVTPTDANRPMFVGMARTDEVERYLHNVQHVTAHAAANYHVTYTTYQGQAPLTPPAHAVPWTAQATGTGAQTLEFVAQQQPGDQVVVVMNADGSGTVSGSAASMVTQPSLTWIGSSLLSGGIIIGVGAVLLVIRGARRHSSAP